MESANPRDDLSMEALFEAEGGDDEAENLVLDSLYLGFHCK